MQDDSLVQVKLNRSVSGDVAEELETISVYQLARAMTPGNFVRLLEDYLNRGGKGFQEGKEIGSQLRFIHRTLQRLAICFALGLICGLAEQEYTDPRNETAIQTAQKISSLLAQGDLPLGPYL